MVGVSCAVGNCYGSKAIKHRFPNPAKHIDLFNKWGQLCHNIRRREYTIEKSVPHTFYRARYRF